MTRHLRTSSLNVYTLNAMERVHSLCFSMTEMLRGVKRAELVLRLTSESLCPGCRPV